MPSPSTSVRTHNGGADSVGVIHGLHGRGHGSVLADGRAVCADRTAPAHRHAGQGARGRPAGDQRHRSRFEVRRPRDGRAAGRLRVEEDVSHNRFVRWAAKAGREVSPTAAILDSQNVKGAEKGRRSIRSASTRARRSKGRSATSSSTPRPADARPGAFGRRAGPRRRGVGDGHPVRPLSVPAQALRRRRLSGTALPGQTTSRLPTGRCRDRQATRSARRRHGEGLHRAATAGSLFDRVADVKSESVVTAGSWLFPRSALSTAAPCVSKRSSPCRTRSPVRHRPQDPTRDCSARVPAGTPLSASRQRISVNDVCAPRQRTPHTAVGQGWNGVHARHIACSTTASLRATATAACLNPMRSTRARPHAFRAESCFTRTSSLAAASNK